MNKHALIAMSVPLLWWHGATAGPSVELRVRGTIKPAACDLVFANGNTVDVGIISKRLLNQSRRTLLPDEQLSFSINCDAPARVSLNLKDHRAGTAAPTASSKPLRFLFGLGAVDSRNVGAYTLSLDQQATADQQQVRMVMAEGQSAWDYSNSFLMPNRRHAWTVHQTGFVPTPFSTLTGVITLAPALAPSSELPQQDEITLDGLASFELDYL